MLNLLLKINVLLLLMYLYPLSSIHKLLFNKKIIKMFHETMTFAKMK